ncbi:hypothetical protein C0995_007775 [Termitomyces sp. Mi166|nr:hypothetical protein C0995_007775 [Termitomyces sp. Mi166\
MTFILTKAGKKLFEKHLEQYAPQDPLYEMYTDSKGKQQRRKRALPPGLSPRDAKILQSVKRRAHYLDKGFHLCGFRFGWTFLIGLIPVVGDVVNALLNYYLVIRKAKQADLPGWLSQRMMMNNLASAVVGSVPVVGDVVVAVFKTNSRNAALLEEMLRLRGEEYMKLQEGDAGGLSRRDVEQVKPGNGWNRMSLILAANAGSSSLKISLFRLAHPVDLVLTCSISNITAPPAQFSFNGATESVPAETIADHASAFSHFLTRIDDPLQIACICHRVVHGGDYATPVVIDHAAYDHIAALSDLAPLHNGAALAVIKACLEKMPKAKSIAYFDSAFHSTIPRHIASYAIDQCIATKRGLRKYGFHGLSYSFILRSVAHFLERPISSLNLIVLHLGSGASACAIKAGRSLDTSMGLTPLSGLPGATRSGAVDPSLIFHYTNKAGRITHDPGMAVNLHVTTAEDILNRKSGWKVLTGTTDFGEIVKRAKIDARTYAFKVNGGDKDGHEEEMDEWTLAFNLFVDRILDFVGAYHLKLGAAVDALVFSGGIGERSKELRQVVAARARCLGYAKVDPAKNAELGEDVVVDIGQKGEGKGEREKRVLVCRTDEQLEMARSCALDEKFWK